MNLHSNINTQGGQLASFLRRFDFDQKDSPLIARSSSAPPDHNNVDDQLLLDHLNHLNLGLDNETYFDHNTKITHSNKTDFKSMHKAPTNQLHAADSYPTASESSMSGLSDHNDPFSMTHLNGSAASINQHVAQPRRLHSHFHQQFGSLQKSVGTSLCLPGSGTSSPGGHNHLHVKSTNSLNIHSSHISPNSNPWQSNGGAHFNTASPTTTGGDSSISSHSTPSAAAGLFLNTIDTPPSSFFPVRPTSALGDNSTSSLGSTSGVYGTSIPGFSHSVSNSPISTQRPPMKYPSGMDLESSYLKAVSRNVKYAAEHNNSIPSSYHQLNDEEALVRQFLRQQQQIAASGHSSYNPILDQMLGGHDPAPRSNSVPPSPRFNGVSSNDDPQHHRPNAHGSSRSFDDYEIYERMLSLGFRLPSGTVPSYQEFVDVVRNPQSEVLNRSNTNHAGFTHMGRKPLHISSSRYNSHSVPVSPLLNAHDNYPAEDYFIQLLAAHEHDHGEMSNRRRSAPINDRLGLNANESRHGLPERNDNHGIVSQDEYPRKNISAGRTHDEYRRTPMITTNGSDRRHNSRDMNDRSNRGPVRQHHDQRSDRTTSQRDGNNTSRSIRRIASNGEERVTDRSAVLEEFRNSKTKRFELNDVYGHIVEFSSDQHGSRFIQQRLEVATDEEKDMVFEEVYPHALQLMTDVFGNYVIQKFFEHGSEHHRVQLATDAMKSNIFSLSLQMYGCRVVQKALEYVDREIQVQIMSELGEYVLTCVKDQNGNHVIQKAIERMTSAKDIQFILDAFHGQLFVLATHPYGCRVVQRIFEHCSDSQIEPLLGELHQHTAALIMDQYGNYVVQHVLEHGTPEDRTLLLDQVKGQVFTLSKHKFASNVVEKCVAFGSTLERINLVDEVVGRDAAPLMAMMKDQFANYVVQRMLDVVEGNQLIELLTKIRPHLSNLRRFTYGKHLISKVEKLLAQTGLGTGSAVGSPAHSMPGSRAQSPTPAH